MITDIQLALFVNFAGTIIVLLLLSYHYVVAYKDEEKQAIKG